MDIDKCTYRRIHIGNTIQNEKKGVQLLYLLNLLTLANALSFNVDFPTLFNKLEKKCLMDTFFMNIFFSFYK